MALLEGLPVIAEDLLEGVFVDPLPCSGHSPCLYHVLASRSTRFCTLLRPPLPIVSPCRDGQKGDSQKRKFLYVALSALRANFWNITPFIRDRLVARLRRRCRV